MTSENLSLPQVFWVWKQNSARFFAESALQEYQEKNKTLLLLLFLPERSFGDNHWTEN